MTDYCSRYYFNKIFLSILFVIILYNTSLFHNIYFSHDNNYDELGNNSSLKLQKQNFIGNLKNRTKYTTKKNINETLIPKLTELNKKTQILNNSIYSRFVSNTTCSNYNRSRTDYNPSIQKISSLCKTIEGQEKYRQKVVDTSNTKHYLLVYATTILFGRDETRKRLQYSCLQSMIYLQSYYPIKFVIFETNNETNIYLRNLGLDVCDDFEHNEFNMPTFRGIFKYIEDTYDSDFYGYINGDIFQSSYIYDLLHQLNIMIMNKSIDKDMLLVGKRISIDYDVFSKSEQLVKEYDLLIYYCRTQGRLDTKWTIDYFIFTKGVVTKNVIDEIVVGRNGVDNYILAYANILSDYFQTIDITDYVNSLHIKSLHLHKENQTKSDYNYNIDVIAKHNRKHISWATLDNTHFIIYKNYNNTFKFIQKSKTDTQMIEHNKQIFQDIINVNKMI